MSTISNERLDSIERQFIEDGFNDITDSEVVKLVSEVRALRKEREAAVPEFYGPYTPAMIGAGVWVTITDELPPQLEGREVWVTTALPVAVPDEEVESEMKWRDLALQFDGHRMQSLCFLKYILSQLPETEFAEAREFLKAGPLSGEEVLRNRIAAMLAAQPIDDDSLPYDTQIAEYEQMMEAELKAAADMEHKPKSELSQMAEKLVRDTTALAEKLSAEIDTTSQQFESLAGKAVGGWIPCSERMPEVGEIVLTADNGCVNVGEMERSGSNYRYFTSVVSGRELPATHWQPLPEPPCK